MFFHILNSKYCKVASRSTSCLVAPTKVLQTLMKGKFDLFYPTIRYWCYNFQLLTYCFGENEIKTTRIQDYKNVHWAIVLLLVQIRPPFTMLQTFLTMKVPSPSQSRGNEWDWKKLLLYHITTFVPRMKLRALQYETTCLSV